MYSRLFRICFLCSFLCIPLYAVYAQTPSRVDILVSPNTHVPLFYRGHTLPSSGSAITLTALPSTSQGITTSPYLYTWKIDGKIQNGGTPSPKNTFSFATGFENQVVVSVDVLNANGTILATKAQQIKIATPEIYFYEKNPLHGLIYKALSDPFVQTSEEMTLRAEGYYMDAQIPIQNLLAQWKLNSIQVATGEDPYEIILKRGTQNQQSELSFHLRNTQQLLQGKEERITVRY